jgi:hypothetical protein
MAFAPPALVNQPIGYTAVDLPRNEGEVDNMMATFIDDAIYNYLNTDGNSSNDVDILFTCKFSDESQLCRTPGGIDSEREDPLRKDERICKIDGPVCFFSS